jgi:multiple sugar transport system permease protein
MVLPPHGPDASPRRHLRCGMTAAAAHAAIAGRVSPRLRQQRVTGLMLAAPAALTLIVLLLAPSSAVIVLSFTDYNLGTDWPTSVGFANYRAVAADAAFRASIVNTAVFVAVVVPASILLGLGFALLIETRIAAKAWYRTAFFLPVTATLVAMATAWEVILHPNFGLLNTILASIGLEKVRFLADPDVALFSIAAIAVWKQVGYNVILFLAGLSTIPRDLYEAAAIDGADGGWRRFLLVTAPMLAPVTLFVTVITLIRAFSEFETVAVLTDGGPLRATSVILFQLYEEAFRYLRIGTGSAIAVLFLVGVATLSLMQTILADRRRRHA